MIGPRCSDSVGEPLAGSAKQESVYVLYEHPAAWGRDVLDGDTFGEELSKGLKYALKRKAGLQLIRRPGREGRTVERPHLFIVHTRSATIEKLRVDGPEAMLSLNLETPMSNGGEAVEHPLLLVCTHGKRDVCCAVKGRPLAAALNSEEVWETSHTKGHRFAPAMILMPWGYSYGRLNEAAAGSLLDSAREGRYFLPGNRGSGLFDAAGQVAEIAVATQLLGTGEDLHFGDLTASGATVTHNDGRVFRVDLEREIVGPVIASCGKGPKPEKVFVARAVQPV